MSILSELLPYISLRDILSFHTMPEVSLQEEWSTCPKVLKEQTLMPKTSPWPSTSDYGPTTVGKTAKTNFSCPPLTSTFQERRDYSNGRSKTSRTVIFTKTNPIPVVSCICF